MLVFAFALRVGLALALPNLFYPDEIFQTLEPAHRLLFGYGVVSWEWRIGARSWLFPGFLAGVMGLSAGLGPGSTGYLLGASLALSAIGVLPVWAAWRIARRRTGAGPALLAAFACAVWSDLVYFAPKALNEIAAGNLLAAAVALAPEREEGPPRAHPWCAGLLFGLAVALRPQLGPAVLAGIAFASRADPRRLAAPLLVGAGASFALGGLVDAVTWGVPFHSVVRNLFENLVVGRASAFGTEPWFGYLRALVRVWAFSFAPMLALFAWGARRHPLPALIAGVVLLVHSAIPHKEYRFVQPAIALVLVVAAVASAELLERLARERPRWIARGLALGAIAWTLASLAAAPRLSTVQILLGERDRSEALYWRRNEGAKSSFALLSERADVCGVALVGLGWAFTGGYTHLHHDVPLLELDDSGEIAEAARYANYLVSRGAHDARAGPYAQERCWSRICLYRRPGGCEPAPGPDLNARIAERGE